MDSKDICYNCRDKASTCIFPMEDRNGEKDTCKKKCKECRHHRCKHRNKCPKLYRNGGRKK